MNWFAWICILLFIIGNVRLLIRMGVSYAHAPVSFERTASLYPLPRQSWFKSAKEVLIEPFTRVLWNKNPFMLIAHVVYHLGFFGGLATYAIVIARQWPSWIDRSSWLGAPWHLCLDMDRVLLSMPSLRIWFMMSAFFGTVGMAIPFILTLRKSRNRIYRPDPNLKMDTLPPSSRKVSVSIQRKIIGLFVLLMDPMILCSVLGTVCEYSVAYRIMAYAHSMIFWLIFAAFPYTFLRHEYMRAGTFVAILRRHYRVLA